MAKRIHCADLPSPDKKLLLDYFNFTAIRIKEQYEPLRPDQLLTYDEWEATTDYPITRKLQIRKAGEVYGFLKPPDHKCEPKRFDKVECYDGIKLPRGINPRSDAFKAWCARYIKSVDNQILHQKPFVKGCTPFEKGQLVKNLPKGLIVYKTDFSNFEGSIYRAMMCSTECRILKRMLMLWPEFVNQYCEIITRDQHIKKRNGNHTTVQAKRMSGDQHTSLGNGTTNENVCAFIAHKSGCTVFEGLFEGDDGLFVVDKVIDESLFSQLGFSIKLERVEKPTEAAFCGLIFSDNGEVIRDPRRFVQKFGWTFNNIHGGTKLMLQLLRAKALSAIYETPQCPIVRPMADYALQITEGYKPRFEYDGFHEWRKIESEKIQPYDPSPETRVLFARQFNIPVETQLYLEQCILKGSLVELSQLMPAPAYQVQYTLRYLEVT